MVFQLILVSIYDKLIVMLPYKKMGILIISEADAVINKMSSSHFKTAA